MEDKDQENARLHAQIRDLEKQNTLIQQFGTVSASAAAVPRANLGMLDPPWADEIEHFAASMPVLSGHSTIVWTWWSYGQEWGAFR